MARYPQTAWQGSDDRHSTTAQARATRAARPEAGTTVHDAIADFLAAVGSGAALDRYGRAFSDEAVTELRWCLSSHVDRRLGALELSDVRRRDVEALIADLDAAGLSRDRLRAVAKSVRGLYDYAQARGLAADNPAERVALPDEDDAEQPSRDRPPARGIRAWLAGGSDRALEGADRALAVFLQVATVCFVLFALALIAESL
jgi:site-specific recombinase XerC